MSEEKFTLGQIILFFSILFFTNYVICLFKNQGIAAALNLIIVFFLIYYLYCEKEKHKKILGQIIEKSIVGIITAIVIAFFALIFKQPIANEINDSIQQNKLISYYVVLGEQGKHEEVVNGITYRIKQGGLYPATKVNLENIKKVSEDVVSVQVNKEQK